MKDNAWASQHVVTANNRHKCSSKKQFGDKAIMSFDYVTSTTSASGTDATGIGRWLWVSMQRKYRKNNNDYSSVLPLQK